jgi:predicted RNA-binding protein with PIN domain
MSKRIMLIDAYNVIHQIPFYSNCLDVSLERARNALIQHCIAWRHTRRDVTDFWIVFDGQTEFAGQSSGSHGNGVQSIFTKTSQTADDKILEIIKYGTCSAAQYTVVSNDNYVMSSSKSLGAKVISVQEFYQESQHKKGKEVSVQDTKEISSKDAKDINKWLSDELGL